MVFSFVERNARGERRVLGVEDVSLKELLYRVSKTQRGLGPTFQYV